MVEITFGEQAIATGLTLVALIYSLGQISGAHFNPAVTIAFWLRGVFLFKRVPIYILSQLAGAFAAVGFLIAIFGRTDDPVPNI